ARQLANDRFAGCEVGQAKDPQLILLSHIWKKEQRAKQRASFPSPVMLARDAPSLSTRFATRSGCIPYACGTQSPQQKPPDFVGHQRDASSAYVLQSEHGSPQLTIGNEAALCGELTSYAALLSSHQTNARVRNRPLIEAPHISGTAFGTAWRLRHHLNY